MIPMGRMAGMPARETPGRNARALKTQRTR